MAIIGDACDCQVIYGFEEAHFRALNADGSPTEGDWTATDCPISISLDPEIEEGARSILRCGDNIRNTYQEDDNLTGVSFTFEMGCNNAELEYIIAGSVGTVSFDTSSPECAIGFCVPTTDEQADAVPFEMRVYQKEVDESAVVGYRETHLYFCKPAFPTYSGNQQEYSTPSWSVDALENPNYDGGKGVYCWEILDAIPS